MSNEAIYYEALKRITKYRDVEYLRGHSEREWGCPFEEAIEYAYENVIAEAKNAIHGKRRPKTEAKAKTPITIIKGLPE